MKQPAISTSGDSVQQSAPTKEKNGSGILFYIILKIKN